MNEDSVNNISREARRHFRKKREYFKDKINELPAFSKLINLRKITNLELN
jgi:hypothetical protein